MSKLKAVAPKTQEPSKPKILIYGQPGVGKTWASLDFPSVYYIDTEGGAKQDHYTDKLTASGGVYMGPDQGSLDFENVIGQLQALATEKHPYKTVVIDSFTKVYNTAIAAEYERLLAKGTKIEFSIEKKPAAAFAKRLLNWISRIDMNVILICHEKSEWKNGEQIGATFDGFEKLSYELDLCLNVVKAGPTRNAVIKKSRLLAFQEGAVFPWSYQEFAARYGEDVIKKESTQIELAKPEQLAEIKRLLKLVNLPDGQETKWLASAQVDEWSEMSSERVDKAILYMKKLLEGGSD